MMGKPEYRPFDPSEHIEIGGFCGKSDRSGGQGCFAVQAGAP
jgi:hypothetical protein